MALVFKSVRGLLITVLVLISIHAFGQDRRWTAGFNVHKLGFFAPKYLSNENIRLGYWFHDYHQTGLELGVYRDARQSILRGDFITDFNRSADDFGPFLKGGASYFWLEILFPVMNYHWFGQGMPVYLLLFHQNSILRLP